MKWALMIVLCIGSSGWATDRVFHGRYVFGHEVESFQPCGSKKSYWAAADETTLQSLRDISNQLRRERHQPYPPIYLEVTGAVDTKSKRDGFAEGYDGLFFIRKIVRTSTVIPTECAK